MKKLFALMLALIMSLSLVACGGGEAADDGAADGAADAAKVVVFWYDQFSIMASVYEVCDDACGDFAVVGVFSEFAVWAAFAWCVVAMAIVY